ncbi:MAG: 4-(cytidine 5'-diphospho)-2-C-methyl-D-erythritol kinase [Bacteroidales bacterium]|nr:4-(cytidine 5'-diphospho)-2-C-methyl-D-erythritol kinase [Bacteroidales bacterium]
MRLYPNVKLNLGLRVLGLRPDGYHELETLFVPCDAFHDRMEIVPSEVFSLKILGPSYGNWPVEKDLVAKAWILFRDEFGIDPVSVLLEKNSPVGAGLGGGSADAAFMIRALNDIFSLELDDATLAALAARLGSDCPFFIYNRPMFASGRGEVLEPFPLDLSAYRIEVKVPAGVSVSTAEAYAGLDAEAGRQSVSAPAAAQSSAMPQPAPMPLREALTLPIAQWRDCVFNDFERSVFPAHPEIAALKEDFYARGAIYAAMSGSGSAVFGIFPAI